MMRELRDGGGIGTPRLSPNYDWSRPALPYGLARRQVGIRGEARVDQEEAAAAVSIEGAQLVVDARRLTGWLQGMSGAWCDRVMAFSWLIIGLVAAYDTYLSVKFQETLPFLEVNPLCRMLIAADEGSVAMLLGFKFAGTVLTLGAILLVYQVHRRIGMAVATVVACLQATLFFYLSLG